MRQLVKIYLENRRQFYVTLLPRIPNPDIQQWLKEAVNPEQANPGILEAMENLNSVDPKDEFSSAFALVDWLKKPTYGQTNARTVISVSEALKRSRDVEETGILLFDMLGQISGGAAVFTQESENCRTALANLIKLEDSLRYHKVKMNLP